MYATFALTTPGRGIEPLKRIENAARRAPGHNAQTAPNSVPKDTELATKEIREMCDALKVFGAAVEAGEMPGFKDSAIRSHGGT